MRRGLAFDSARANARPNHLFDGAGAYALIGYHLAMLRQGQSDSAEFATLASHVDPAKWPAPVVAFLSSRLTAPNLLSAAAVSGEADTPDQRCAAEFYIGEASLAAHRTDDAKQHFQATIAGCPKRFSEYHGARAELARLQP
jgi:lipoprotein NlpI